MLGLIPACESTPSPAGDLASLALRARDKSEEPPTFTGQPLVAQGRWRDLDAAASYAMTEAEVGLVDTVDNPEAGSGLPGETARVAGSRTLRLITMKDREIWLRVSWKGAGAAVPPLDAAKTIQEFEFRTPDGQPEANRREQRFAKAMASRLAALAHRDK